MKSLATGCAAAALMLGLANAALAEIVVRDVPVHTVPADGGGGDDGLALPAQAAGAPQIDPSRAEPAPVQALVHPKAPPAPALTADETAFFDTLGQRVTDAASTYESYVRRAGGIDPAFNGGAAVHKALAAGAAYHPAQLEEGVVAYAALIALRDPAFVDGVRSVRDPAFFDTLAASPERVLRVPGAADAAGDVAGVLRAQGQSLIAAGRAVTQAAYDIQAQAWSKAPVGDPQGVLQEAKASAEQMRAATTPSKEKLLASLVSAPQAPMPQGLGQQGLPTNPGAPDVVRGLALAALAIEGRTGDGKEAAFEALLHDAAGVDCLKSAKLNLNQCLAVAGPHYEDVYCLGRHALSDTGRCVAAAADGGADAANGPPAAPPLPQAGGYGPEQAEAYGKPVPAQPDEDSDVAQPSGAAPMPQAPQAAPAQGAYAQNGYAPAPYPAQQPYPQLYAQPYPAQQPAYPTQAAYQGQGYQQGYQGGYAPAPQPQAYAQAYQPYGYAARGYYDGR